MRRIAHFASTGTLRAAAVAGLLGLALGAPAFAQADGQPRLDPTDGVTGTLYEFIARGATKSMDPGRPNGQLGTVRGDLLILQDPGTGEFSADGGMDVDGDGFRDGNLACEGYVGLGRFAMGCVGFTDDGDPITILLTGRAVRSSGGRVSLRKTGGLGYTDGQTINFAFQAEQQ